MPPRPPRIQMLRKKNREGAGAKAGNQAGQKVVANEPKQPKAKAKAQAKAAASKPKGKDKTKAAPKSKSSSETKPAGKAKSKVSPRFKVKDSQEVAEMSPRKPHAERFQEMQESTASPRLKHPRAGRGLPRPPKEMPKLQRFELLGERRQVLHAETHQQLPALWLCGQPSRVPSAPSLMSFHSGTRMRTAFQIKHIKTRFLKLHLFKPVFVQINFDIT